MDELKKARQMLKEPGSNCLYYLKKSHGLSCAYELVNRCQHLMPIQEGDVVMFWKKLEIGYDIHEEHHRDMESEMRDLTSLLLEISTDPISNVRGVRRLIKGVIHPVLSDDPSQPLSIPPRDRSHEGTTEDEFHQKGKISLGIRSRSNPSPRGRGRPSRSGRSRGSGRSSGRLSLSIVVSPDSPPVPFPFKNAFPGFTYRFIQNWKNVVRDGNCGFQVVSNFLFGDENHWVEIRRRMSYDLRHHMQVYEQLFGSIERLTELIMQTNREEGLAPREYWINTPDHLYVIANTFNQCVVFLARSQSTTVLPLVSNMDGPLGMIFVGLIEELQPFIQLVDGCPLPPLHVQWEYHRDIRVSGWAAPYRNRMAD
ncbi:hypothetical protein M9H77_31553 [Catharanthus roseus]|uniref:Uncharacterized protein n=1 Tax=Catharanthus roseus TaxID=4058 RepID=A0ACC0A1C7_CATRO|nr:hypothetical protein M9H77_31553 [Catharanthus roseus]